MKHYKKESLLRECIREYLSESVEFRELKSPLTYARAWNVDRLALCDSSVTEPPEHRDDYFKEWEDWRRYSKRGGKRLKKPVLDEIIPGVSDVCIIGFLDFHKRGENYWYIDYMKTRGGYGGQKVASRLIDEFFSRYAKPGGTIHFGKMMQPQIGHLKDKMNEKYPEINVIGAKEF